MRITDRRPVLRLGKETVSGVGVLADVAKHRLRMDVFGIPGPGNRLLVLQDNPDPSGGPSREAAFALKELEASFALVR